MNRPVRRIVLAPGGDLERFRAAARHLVATSAAPDQVLWEEDDSDGLFAPERVSEAGPPLALPRAAAELIVLALRHRDPARYSLLYELIWRITHGENALAQIACDPLTHRLGRMISQVRRDIHKMHAFVRFRRLQGADEERYLAWFEPDHWIVETAAPFFVNRFRGVGWAILTPKGSLRWDRRSLAVGPPASRDDAPGADAFEGLWLDYYDSIFNPARLNPAVMRGHMAVKYWKNLPETAAIPSLIRTAASRVEAMIEREGQTPLKRNPDKAVLAMAQQAPPSLEALNRLIAESRPPEPFSPRAVLGEGPIGAPLALVGEQPGDQEDLIGRPFVGPAGRLLDEALAAAGVARSEAYVTNAVKNFKFRPSGKRRIHQSPTAGEIKHYRWWLERELEFVRPRVVVALGSSATQALAGKPIPVLKNRGPTTAFDPWRGVITVHPSSVLREPDAAARAGAFKAFVEDLKGAARMAEAA